MNKRIKAIEAGNAWLLEKKVNEFIGQLKSEPKITFVNTTKRYEDEKPSPQIVAFVEYDISEVLTKDNDE